MKQFTIKTTARFQTIDITGQVRAALRENGMQSGLCCVFVPHTTAAVTINENADPDVQRDLIAELDKVVPLHDNYRHTEGNSAAHVKSSLVGASELVVVERGQLVLGTWQSLFFCEFDGPRTRQFYVKFIPG